MNNPKRCGAIVGQGHGDSSVCGEPHYGTESWQCRDCALDELRECKSECERLTSVITRREQTLTFYREEHDAQDKRIKNHFEIIDSLADDRDQLKSENIALRKALTDCADSLYAEMLQKFGGQIPDDMHPVTRREYDRDMEEVARYRNAIGKGDRQ